MNKETFRMLAALERCGITMEDALALRRIAMTLHAWAEHECNGTIQRDEDGRPRAYYETRMGDHIRGGIVRDAEKGAQKRLAAIMARYPHLIAYEQGDPRGAPLYILDRKDLGAADISSVYSRGVAVHS